MCHPASPLLCSPWSVKLVFRATAASGFLGADPCQSDSTACKLHVTRAQDSSIPFPFTTVASVPQREIPFLSYLENYFLSLLCFDFSSIFCNFARIFSTLMVTEHHKKQLYCLNDEGSYCGVLNGKGGKRTWSDLLSVYPFLWKYTEENTWIPRYLVKDVHLVDRHSLQE